MIAPGIILPALGALAFASSLVYAADTPHQAGTQDTAKHRKALAELRQRIQTIQQQIKTTRNERSNVSRELRSSEQRISRIVLSLRDLAAQQKEQQQRLRQFRQRAVAQQKALQKERDVLARQVRAAHMMGHQEKIKIILNQQDPAAISRVIAYYGYFNRERVRRMKSLREYILEMNATRQQIIDRQAKLQNIQDQREEQKQAIEQAQQNRRQAMRQLDAELAEQGAELKQLHNNARQLEKLLDKLRKALADVTTAPLQRTQFGKLRGKLGWPVKGRLMRTFGAAKIGKLRWDGVMIAATAGTEVRATHHGRVAFADWLRGFGLLLIIDHGDGYLSLYGHNQSLFKEVGDWVESAEPIASVGSTGGRKKPAVYFAIRRNGRAVNPAKWCKAPVKGRVG